MRMWNRLAITLTVLLEGCATPYRPPTEPPPAEWTGDSGFEVQADTIKVYEGARRPRDVLIEYGVQFRRTAVVLETVQTKDAYGRDFILAEGTKLFATNFTLTSQTGVWGNKQLRQSVDPIEWCAVLPHGVDGKQADSDTACLFWESPTQARYMQDFRNGGYRFNPEFIGTAGMPGPVPKIKVQPVDFGVAIVAQVRLVKVNAKRVELEVVMSDGTSERRTELNTLTWRDGAKAWPSQDLPLRAPQPHPVGAPA